MAESELKLDQYCPWCGTSNAPSAQRCRQCFQSLQEETSREGGLFDMPRPNWMCPACGCATLLGSGRCEACGADLGELKAAVPAPKPKRRRVTVSPGLGIVKIIWLMRLCATLYLFWSILDTSNWLVNVTSGLSADDLAAVRYNIYAIFELVRNVALVLGVWLLTLLRPRQAT